MPSKSWEVSYGDELRCKRRTRWISRYLFVNQNKAFTELSTHFGTLIIPLFRALLPFQRNHVASSLSSLSDTRVRYTILLRCNYTAHLSAWLGRFCMRPLSRFKLPWGSSNSVPTHILWRACLRRWSVTNLGISVVRSLVLRFVFRCCFCLESLEGDVLL